VTVERATEHSRQRECPACGAPSVVLPVFTTRRRSPMSCTNCGAGLSVVYHAPYYYTLALVTGLLFEMSFLPVLLLLILHEWWWLAAIFAATVAINYLASAFLNSRARVEFSEPRDSRRDSPGRWYPKVPGD
jgi:hypothetical protein